MEDSSTGRPPRSQPPASLTPSALPLNGGNRPPRERPAINGDKLSSSSFATTTTLSTTSLDNPLPSIPYQRVQFQPPAGAASSSSSWNPSAPSHSSRINLLPTTNTHTATTGTSTATDFKRKRSLVRPDRARVDENDRLYNYRVHAAQYEAEGRGQTAIPHQQDHPGYNPTGRVAAVYGNHHNIPSSASPQSYHHQPQRADGVSSNARPDYDGARPNLRRGKSVLAREEGMAQESGLSMFKRGQTLRRANNSKQSGGAGVANAIRALPGGAHEQRHRAKAQQRQHIGPWMLYCRILTVCCPSPLLKCFGLRTKDRQNAWREKIGLLSVIACAMAFVGFLTFGFTASVCGTPALRYKHNTIEGGSMIFHGYVYDLDNFTHPAALGIEGGSNPLYTGYTTGSRDGSFMFQTVNEACLDVITPAPNSGIINDGRRMGWYFPCNVYNQFGTSVANLTGYAEGTLCHTQANARDQFNRLRALGQVYFPWDELKNNTRNLGVYDGAVLDFGLLNWLDRSQVSFPEIFDRMRSGDDQFKGKDITSLIMASNQRKVAECLTQTIRVGFVDSESIGCVASDIVLYVSLVVIIGVVAIRFFMAVLFGWFLSWKIGKYPHETYEQRRARAAEIEDWTDDIYRPAPARYRPNAKLQKKSMLPKTSRFTKGELLSPGGHSGSTSPTYRSKSRAPSLSGSKSLLGMGMRNSPPDSPGGPSASRSSTSLPNSSYLLDGMARGDNYLGSACPFPLGDIVPQPPADYQPFNYPLAHTILLVTAYSESVEGLRTTLDSLATTDYPNSHKVILVIADGMVKGSGNALTTPEIVLGMMKEFVTQPEDVEALSYVAIADGHKRHNMAKVYAGFYEYDDNTVEKGKQQRVPMMLVAKVGNPSEVHEPKPGNRGKRDSQIVLMSFLQKVMFDERMTTLEYEFFNSLWRCTGVSPDRYETVLCVDADTKVFPDSISRMNACMVNDPEIMGLCGETKIANKSETWVTMIQVFEYYVSHHLTKAFESMFGGVTCLPGCFSMYRIKAPKGGDGYWVPLLANPDIVEHYSENVVDTLHKKNLLLLGEDRYLSTLMLRTFPRRKMMFCPQAVCKTVVPDTFRVLLSQRRRWINSTVHNLFELFIVPDLCGTFCFSMRFVVFMELAGTLVLPAAIAFTLYLIVVAIIPGTTKPILSLILLAIILGIPAVLIVVTSRRVAYLGWMLIYLLSLPIWNFVLPAYAFFHMDDFSWGQTRKIIGDDGKTHGDKDGVFDSSHIVMKRWADFERERRYRSGNVSRDSTYDLIRRESPRRAGSTRYSVVSSADTYSSLPASGSGMNEAFYRRGSPSESGGYGPRYPATLELPAPLAPQGVSPASSTSSIQAGIPAQQDYPRYAEAGYDSDELEREAILASASPPLESQPFPLPRNDSVAAYSDSLGRPPTESLSSSSSHQHAVAASVSASSSSGVGSASEFASNNPFASHARVPSSKPRGVSLVDDGPVAGAEGMRVVQRNSRRSSTHQSMSSNAGVPPAQHQQPPQPRSRASYGPNLLDPQSPTSSSSMATEQLSNAPGSFAPSSINSRQGPSLPRGAAPPSKP